jgi:hypothetical protein
MEGASPQHSLIGCPQQVTPDTEEVLGDSVHRQEPLRLSGGLEPPHLSLSLSRRLVGNLRSIVPVSAGVVDDGRHDRSLRRGITPQLVRDQPPRRASLTLQQLTKEAFSRTPIATRLDEDVDHVAVLVDSTPEIVLLAPNVDEQFIQVPRIAQATLSPLESTRILGAKLPAPLSDGLVGNQDPPLCQEIFDITEAQAEAVVEPDGVADDLWGKSESVVAGRIIVHGPSLPVTASS